ncbi:unnamed protein product, partial [Polarella glacialis]
MPHETSSTTSTTSMAPGEEGSDARATNMSNDSVVALEMSNLTSTNNTNDTNITHPQNVTEPNVTFESDEMPNGTSSTTITTSMVPGEEGSDARATNMSNDSVVALEMSNLTSTNNTNDTNITQPQNVTEPNVTFESDEMPNVTSSSTITTSMVPGEEGSDARATNMSNDSVVAPEMSNLTSSSDTNDTNITHCQNVTEPNVTFESDEMPNETSSTTITTSMVPGEEGSDARAKNLSNDSVVALEMSNLTSSNNTNDTNITQPQNVTEPNVTFESDEMPNVTSSTTITTSMVPGEEGSDARATNMSNDSVVALEMSNLTPANDTRGADAMFDLWESNGTLDSDKLNDTSLDGAEGENSTSNLTTRRLSSVFASETLALCKLVHFRTVGVGISNVTIPADTSLANFTHFVIFTRSSSPMMEQESTYTTLPIEDMSASVSSVSFEDEDMDVEEIGGTVFWVKPTNLERVYSYRIYVAINEVGANRSMIGADVPAEANSTDIPIDAPSHPFLLVYTRSRLVEQTTPVALAVFDNETVEVLNQTLEVFNTLFWWNNTLLRGGEFKLCWCPGDRPDTPCGPGATFATTGGAFLLRGPGGMDLGDAAASSGAASGARRLAQHKDFIAGVPFQLRMRGFKLTTGDRARLLPSGGDPCSQAEERPYPGEAGVVLSTPPTVAADGLSEEWENATLLVSGYYEVCWCPGHIDGRTGCTGDYSLLAGTFFVSGAERVLGSGGGVLQPFAGISTRLEVWGTKLTSTDVLKIVRSSSARCGEEPDSSLTGNSHGLTAVPPSGVGGSSDSSTSLRWALLFLKSQRGAVCWCAGGQQLGPCVAEPLPGQQGWVDLGDLDVYGPLVAAPG